MTTKSMAYDHPAYLTRMQHVFPAKAAGASSTYEKFVAFTAMTLFSLGVSTVTAGTSSYTLWNGTATVTTTGTGDSITGYKVMAAGGTSTYGPFALNAAALGFNKIQLAGAGTASYAGSATADGGVPMAQGDVFYLVTGTDANAVIVPCIEFAIAPGAAVSN